MRCKRQRMNLITRRKEPANCCRPAPSPGRHYPPSPSLAGRRVRVVVTPGCNVNQLHYHKLLLAYVSVPSQERAGCAEQTLLHSAGSKVEGKQRNSDALEDWVV